MLVFHHSIPVNGGSATAGPTSLDLVQLWEILVHKAANPVSFVPSITAAKVLERENDSFVREITLRDAFTVLERVEFEPKRRIIFHQLSNPDLVAITNELSDDRGELMFTFTASVSPAGLERSRREAGWVAENDLLFYDTARATINTAKLLAASGVKEQEYNRLTERESAKI